MKKIYTVLISMVVITNFSIAQHLTISSDTLKLGYTANSSGSITVTSDLALWRALHDISVTWISVNPISGSYNGTVTVTAEANPSFTLRRAQVFLSGTGVSSQTLNIIQQAIPATLDLSATTLSLESIDLSGKSLDITSNTSCTASSSETWLKAFVNSGKLNVSALSENVSAASRTATVTVSTNSEPVVSKTVTVTQKNTPASLILYPGFLTSSIGSTGVITISTNTTWTATCDQTWVAMSTTSGTKNGHIDLTAVSENKGFDARTAIVTVTANGLPPQTTTITQSGTPTINVSANTITIDSTTTSNSSLTVTSNISWTAISNYSWLTVSPASSSTNGTLTITADGNLLDLAPRTGYIILSGSGATTKTITVTQLNTIPKLTVSSKSFTLNTANNSSGIVNVMSNTHWTLFSYDSWISITPGTGSNNGKATITATSANPYTTERTATVRATASYATPIDITITQLGTNPALTLSTNNLLLPSVSNSAGKINVVSNISSWNASSNASWLTVSPATGSLMDTVTFTATSANSTAVARTATVTVSASGVTSKTITVTQSAGTTFQNQSITFNPLDAKKVGDVDFDPGATSTSGLNVSYNSSNLAVATIMNGKIHIVGAGTTNITASQTGNSAYNPASDIVRTLTVSLASGIAKATENTAECYPNPVHEKLFIKRNCAKLATLTLFDVTGRKIFTQLLSEMLETIDVLGLQPGIYILTISNNGIVKTMKIIVNSTFRL